MATPEEYAADTLRRLVAREQASQQQAGDAAPWQELIREIGRHLVEPPRVEQETLLWRARDVVTVVAAVNARRYDPARAAALLRAWRDLPPAQRPSDPDA